jgi:hypothetical protein
MSQPIETSFVIRIGQGYARWNDSIKRWEHLTSRNFATRFADQKMAAAKAIEVRRRYPMYRVIVTEVQSHDSNPQAR